MYYGKNLLKPYSMWQRLMLRMPPPPPPLPHTHTYTHLNPANQASWVQTGQAPGDQQLS